MYVLAKTGVSTHLNVVRSCIGACTFNSVIISRLGVGKPCTS